MDAHGPAMSDLAERLVAAVGAAYVLPGDAEGAADHAGDEALGIRGGTPSFVVWPATRDEVLGVVDAARATRTPVVARGAGTGLSGAAAAPDGAIVVAFGRMDRILDLDAHDQVAVVQPGVSLAALDAAAGEVGLSYPVYPGEQSASLGGTVATNAGGMRAVRHGVTRAHVTGLEAVLTDGTVVRAGGRLAKVSAGYDAVQLLVGSEGTLALLTEVTVRLTPAAAHRRTLLAPFRSLDAVTDAVSRVVATGLGPSVCEYLDEATMTAVCDTAGITLGVPDAARGSDYLLVELAGRRADRLDEDAAELGELLAGLGAPDVFVLPDGAAHRLVEARERTFWTIKAAGADEIVDVVVPRSAMAPFLTAARAAGAEHGARVLGCGHAGDGNVHLAVFAPDAAAAHATVHAVLALGVGLGGAISGEHGVGRAKAAALAELGDPGTLTLLRRVRAALDPDGVLNPGCSVS